MRGSAAALIVVQALLALGVLVALARLVEEGVGTWLALADHVSVRLGTMGGAVVLEVADDGTGFDPEATFAGHLGLHSMRERATIAGGTLAIDSSIGEGTRVSVCIPLDTGKGTG